MRRTELLLLTLVIAVFLASTVLAIGGGDIVFRLSKADPVQFSHDFHAKTRGLKCAACHFNKFARGTGYEMKKEAITKRDFCEHCHNGMKGFDASSDRNCGRCHKKQP